MTHLGIDHRIMPFLQNLLENEQKYLVFQMGVFTLHNMNISNAQVVYATKIRRHRKNNSQNHISPGLVARKIPILKTVTISAYRHETH